MERKKAKVLYDSDGDDSIDEVPMEAEKPSAAIALNDALNAKDTRTPKKQENTTWNEFVNDEMETYAKRRQKTSELIKRQYCDRQFARVYYLNRNLDENRVLFIGIYREKKNSN